MAPPTEKKHAEPSLAISPSRPHVCRAAPQELKPSLQGYPLDVLGEMEGSPLGSPHPHMLHLHCSAGGTLMPEAPQDTIGKWSSGQQCLHCPTDLFNLRQLLPVVMSEE